MKNQVSFFQEIEKIYDTTSNSQELYVIWSEDLGIFLQKHSHCKGVNTFASKRQAQEHIDLVKEEASRIYGVQPNLVVVKVKETVVYSYDVEEVTD